MNCTLRFPATSKNHLNKSMEQDKSNRKFKLSLTHSILIATVLGMIVGYLVGPAIAPIKIFGDIFLRLIQMSVPLIILGAVLEAVGQINPFDLF